MPPNAARPRARGAQQSSPNDETSLVRSVASVKSTPSGDPLSALVETAVDRALERRWDELLEALSERHRPQYLDSAGVCQMLSISPPTLRRMVEDGLPSVRCGEARRYDPDAVRQWLASRGTP
jgi:excisionase family DNA binding protein